MNRLYVLPLLGVAGIAGTTTALLTTWSNPSSASALRTPEWICISEDDIAGSPDPRELGEARIHRGEHGMPDGIEVVKLHPYWSERLALQPGDVFKSVNGHPLHSLRQARQIHPTLSQARELVYTFERGGQLLELNVRLDDCR